MHHPFIMYLHFGFNLLSQPCLGSVKQTNGGNALSRNILTVTFSVFNNYPTFFSITKEAIKAGENAGKL